MEVSPPTKKRKAGSIGISEFDRLSSEEKIKWIAKCILKFDNIETLLFLLEHSNIKPASAFSHASKLLMSNPGIPDKEKTELNERLFDRIMLLNKFQEGTKKAIENFEERKDDFLKKFFTAFNLDAHFDLEDGNISLNKNLESYQYLSRTSEHEYHLSLNSINCRICGVKYQKFVKKGTIDVCVPCLNRYACYKFTEIGKKRVQEEVQKYREKMKKLDLYLMSIEEDEKKDHDLS